MQPYKNHTEHLDDILKFHTLYANKSPDADNFAQKIAEREETTTETFLPALHLRRSFGISNASCLYTMIALSVNGLRLSETSNIETLEKKLIQRQLSGLLDEQDESFKQRVADFIIDPYTPIGRPWLSYNHKIEEATLIENVVIEISHLVQAFINQDISRTNIIWVYGRQGSGRKTHIAHAVGRLPVMFIDMEQIAGHNNFEAYLEELLFEYKLMGALPCFYGIANPVHGAGALNALLPRITNLAGVVFMVSENAPGYWDRKGCNLAEVFVPQLPAELAQRIWRNWAKHYTFDAEPDFNLLASRYEITPLQIKQCLDSAHNQTIARGEEHIKTVELPQVCKSSRLKQLPLLGRPANIPFKWEALILPEPIKLTLESVVERIANRGKVFREWGFGEVMPYGQGVTVLLEGHPGTGKTMAAHALAERVGLPMYKIDLSAVMSKYIGETEKNLQALFDEAGETDCVLFFDEAEALFGKRTDVKDSKDKYANLEVSFLLQRLEEHRGLTILATNLAKNFDDAFKRRFQFVIQLPLPDSGQREKIWRSAFPPQTPVSPDIDYNYLAKRYEFSGSGIKNIVLAAAFQAVSQNKPLDMACILNAIEIESAKGGTAPLR